MNKQIQELRGQVKLDIDQYQESLLKLGAFVLADDGGNEVLNAYLAKFAELIVKECLGIVNRHEYSYHEADPLWETAQLIKEHFGMSDESVAPKVPMRI